MRPTAARASVFHAYASTIVTFRGGKPFTCSFINNTSQWEENGPRARVDKHTSHYQSHIFSGFVFADWSETHDRISSLFPNFRLVSLQFYLAVVNLFMLLVLFELPAAFVVLSAANAIMIKNHIVSRNGLMSPNNSAFTRCCRSDF